MENENIILDGETPTRKVYEIIAVTKADEASLVGRKIYLESFGDYVLLDITDDTLVFGATLKPID